MAEALALYEIHQMEKSLFHSNCFCTDFQITNHKVT